MLDCVPAPIGLGPIFGVGATLGISYGICHAPSVHSVLLMPHINAKPLTLKMLVLYWLVSNQPSMCEHVSNIGGDGMLELVVGMQSHRLIVSEIGVVDLLLYHARDKKANEEQYAENENGEYEFPQCQDPTTTINQHDWVFGST